MCLECPLLSQEPLRLRANPQGLDAGQGRESDNEERDRGRDRNTEPVTPQEFAGPVEACRCSCGYGQTRQVIPYVGLELFGRDVAAGRVLFHRLEDDAVQITAECFGQLERASVSAALGTQDRDRRELGLLLEHRPNDLMWLPGRQTIRECASA